MMLHPTQEQQEVIAAAKTGKDLVVQALAGTGKTTTLRLLAESLVGKQGTYIAFNRAIVDEATGKFPPNVNCRTAHSLAFRQVGFRYRKRLDNQQRKTLKQISEWMAVEKISYKIGKENYVLEREQVANLVLSSISNFCKSADKDLTKSHIEIPYLATFDKKQSRNFQDKLLPIALNAWQDILNVEGYLKFTHDYYLKIWQLSNPKIKGDFILFDEAQDADPVMLDIVESQLHAQKIYCGDQYQAIYEWRGAENALSKVKVDKRLWLTQSFRFGEAIAAEANDVLEFLQAPVKVRGLTNLSSKVEKLEKPKAILCRTNAGVIQQVLEQLKKNRAVAVVGQVQELIEFAKACGQLQEGKRTGHHELAPFKSWKEAKEYVDRFPRETQEIKTMIELVSRFGVESLILALNKVVSEQGAEVTISTAHKAKGREWDTVKLAGDYLHPVDMDTEDLRLAYVSVTRAIRILDMSEWEKITIRDDLSQESPIDSSTSSSEDEIFETTETENISRRGLRWSYLEDMKLVNECIAGNSLESIALELNRTISGIQARVAKWYLHASLGRGAKEIDSISFSNDGWDETKLDTLFDLWESDITLDELSSILGVSEQRIASQAIINDLVIFDQSFIEAVKDFYED
jgi:superfamily I DNA/RNA helicase